MIAAFGLSTHSLDGKIGVLSVHPDGRPCRVGCEFCYLGARVESRPPVTSTSGPYAWRSLLSESLARLDWQELAFALSEPDAEAEVLATCAQSARARGRALAVTTTLAIAHSHPALIATPGVTRVNLSVDPRKGSASPERVAHALEALTGAGAKPEIVLIVSLTDERFAESLIAGRLDELLAVRGVDKIALNALKPPPAWCDRAFWLRALARLGPLLARELDRRVFLDCYVAARIVGLGGCPARADLTPSGAALAFRSCVYQPAPDFVAADATTLARRLRGFTPPSACPFPIV